MRIVAILAIRNEQSRLANCLKYLVENEIEFAIIDNGSTDGSDAILREPRFSPWLVAHRFQPFDGVFDLKQLLMMKQEIIRTIDADWVIHLDADEIMHPYRPGESLRAGITRLDSEGWDVINYDEFVFLPIDRAYVTDCEDMQPLRYYYLFEPENRTLMRAWGKDTGLSNVEFAGHKLSGGEFRIAPESFVLRHYIFRDQEHAFTKYLHLGTSRRMSHAGGISTATISRSPSLPSQHPRRCIACNSPRRAISARTILAQSIIGSGDCRVLWTKRSVENCESIEAPDERPEKDCSSCGAAKNRDVCPSTLVQQ